ncbi:MAG TPA: large conductance mechanosensitive channel protein MscL [Armatimonadota bacterium]|jgi:large conductance mechanosensitive channel
MFKEFKEFISKGSVIDLAIGIIIGAAFTAVVNSLVKEVIMPPIGLLLGKVDFDSLFINLSDKPVTSLAAAKAAGVPVIAYGSFLNAVISFVVVALVVFLLVRSINRFRAKPEPTHRDCPFCLEKVGIAATRCSHCTSELPPAEAEPAEG